MATSHLAPALPSAPPRNNDGARQAASSPSVVILNMFHSGLGIARALAGKGIRVIGLSADPKIYGNYTRLCEVRMAPSSNDAPEQLLHFLSRSTDLSGAVIFPTRDADVHFLDRFRTELHAYRLAIPSAYSVEKSMNKYELVLRAREAGIPVPRTAQVHSAAELQRAGERVGFPCVLKPVSAFEWRIGDAWRRVGSRKAVRVASPEALRQEYETVSGITPRVLVQEWIPGKVEQMVVLGGYADEDSHLVAYFTARKLLQSPPDCGTGCVLASEPILELVAPTEKLLAALRYQGMAEVEYKLDARSGQYKLIEINTRHWDQHELGQASGINLTWIAYCHLTGRNSDGHRRQIVRAKWIAEDAVFLYCLRALYRRQIRPRELWSKLAGRKVYSIFAWNDPLPLLRYAVCVFLPKLAKSILRRFYEGALS